MYGYLYFDIINRQLHEITLSPSKKEPFQNGIIRFDLETYRVESDDMIPWDGQCDDLGLLAYDFLRSKSYLIGFNGLSVEEIITRGWDKYKENKI